MATFTLAVSYVDRQTLAVLAPTVTRALRISEVRYGWLAAAFSIAYLLAAPLAGRWIDRVGARRALVASLLVWSIVAGLHSLATGFALLFALRIALGLAEAPTFPGAVQVIQRALPPADRARGFGFLFTGSSFGAMIAPPLATAIAWRFGWQAGFLGTSLVGLLWIPLWIGVAFPAPARRLLDHVAPRPTEPSRSGRSLARLVARPEVLRAVLLVFALSPASSFVLLWGAKYLVAAERVRPNDVGFYLWIPPLLLDVGSVLFGDLAGRLRRGGRSGVAPLLVALAALLCGLPLAGLFLARGARGATLLLALASAGNGGMSALVTIDLMARVAPYEVSTSGGLLAAAQSLAYVAANPLIGLAIGRGSGYPVVGLGLAIFLAPGAIGWLALTRRIRRGDVTDSGRR